MSCCDNCQTNHEWTVTTGSMPSHVHDNIFTSNTTMSILTCACECHQPVMKTRVEIEVRLAVMRSITPCPQELKLMCETLEWVLGYT